MIKRIECNVSGRVQMVMYRDFAMRAARARNIVGEVWNKPDGDVGVIAEGEEAVLQDFVTMLHRGSLLSHVEDVVVEWRDPTSTYTQFTIRYT